VTPDISAPSRRRPLLVVTSVLLCGLLPLWPLFYVFRNVIVDGAHVTDFRNTFYPAAEAVLHGDSPYPLPTDDAVALGRAYVYPPLTALATTPFTALPLRVAEVIVLALLVGVVFLTLRVLEVRDWRCYGIVFLWPPVIAAIKIGNITLLLGLGAALAWRYRESAARTAASLGLALGAKIFLWPLLVWLGGTRRVPAVAAALAVAASGVFASWAVIGFAGISDYPDLLHRLQDVEADQSYSLYALLLDLGTASSIARALWLVLGLVLLGCCFLLARRGDDRRAFVLALTAALACSPVVWLNYFALLLVALAVAEPRLGPAWFVPLAMYGSASTFNGTTLQTALTLAAAALTVGVALRPLRVPRPTRSRSAMSPAVQRP
jgi:Glycosyltransferase family 87